MKIHAAQRIVSCSAHIRAEALVVAASYTSIAASTFALAREARTVGASPMWQLPAILGIAAAIAVPYAFASAISGQEWGRWSPGAKLAFTAAALPATLIALMALSG